MLSSKIKNIYKDYLLNSLLLSKNDFYQSALVSIFSVLTQIHDEYNKKPYIKKFNTPLLYELINSFRNYYLEIYFYSFIFQKGENKGQLFISHSFTILIQTIALLARAFFTFFYFLMKTAYEIIKYLFIHYRATIGNLFFPYSNKSNILLSIRNSLISFGLRSFVSFFGRRKESIANIGKEEFDRNILIRLYKFIQQLSKVSPYALLFYISLITGCELIFQIQAVKSLYNYTCANIDLYLKLFQAYFESYTVEFWIYTSKRFDHILKKFHIHDLEKHDRQLSTFERVDCEKEYDDLQKSVEFKKRFYQFLLTSSLSRTFFFQKFNSEFERNLKTKHCRSLLDKETSYLISSEESSSYQVMDTFIYEGTVDKTRKQRESIFLEVDSGVIFSAWYKETFEKPCPPTLP